MRLRVTVQCFRTAAYRLDSSLFLQIFYHAGFVLLYCLAFYLVPYNTKYFVFCVKIIRRKTRFSAHSRRLRRRAMLLHGG